MGSSSSSHLEYALNFIRTDAIHGHLYMCIEAHQNYILLFSYFLLSPIVVNIEKNYIAAHVEASFVQEQLLMNSCSCASARTRCMGRGPGM